MISFIENLLTKNKTEIPLLYITFDYQKYKQQGKLGSCTAHLHPMIRNDGHLISSINKLIDYIRDNYDMEGA